MPQTPDRFPGEREDEGILLDDSGIDPTEVGGIRRVGSDIKARDGAGVFNLRSGGGITEGQHEDLDTLVHDLAETSYVEVTRSGGRVTDVIVWTTAGKTTKVREANVTRASGQVSTLVEKQYDVAGVLKQTLTHVYTRAAGQVASIATTET